MVVEVFTLYDLVHKHMLRFHNDRVDKWFSDRAVLKGDYIHVNGPFRMSFFNHVREASVAANIHCRHIHYSVSPNTEIRSDIELAWGIMSLMPLLSDTLANPPEVLILSTDSFSAKYLEYLRNQLPKTLSSLQGSSQTTIISNWPVVQLNASHQIHPTDPN